MILTRVRHERLGSCTYRWPRDSVTFNIDKTVSSYIFLEKLISVLLSAPIFIFYIKYDIVLQYNIFFLIFTVEMMMFC